MQHLFLVLTTNFQAQPPQLNQSGDQDKFAPLDSPLAPFSIPAWRAALQAVDRSHPGEGTSACYAFPDPGLFVSPGTNEKKAKFIETWLRIHEAWAACVAQGGVLAMSAQLWHDILATNFSNQMGTADTKAAKHCQRIHSILILPSSDPSVKPRSTAGEPLIWQGQSYTPGILPAENVVCQILWELYKLNFTQELLSLDCRTCGNLELTDNEQVLECQLLVLRCFKGFNSIPLPNGNCGLIADTIRDQFPYLQFMVQVMLA